MEYMNHIFNDELLPAFGNNPYRFKNGVETIVPYQIDEFGIYTDKMYKSKGVGGTNIPEALLYEFIRRLVEHDKCTVKCGDLTMKGEFSPELFEEMKANLDKEKSI